MQRVVSIIKIAFRYIDGIIYANYKIGKFTMQISSDSLSRLCVKKLKYRNLQIDYAKSITRLMYQTAHYEAMDIIC